MDFFNKAYTWFWYHTEFWLKPKDRRPYTYIMRDFYHQLPFVTILILSFGFYALGNFGFHLSVKDFFLILITAFVGILLGHLFWGTKYTEGEQENPEYIEPGDEK